MDNFIEYGEYIKNNYRPRKQSFCILIYCYKDLPWTEENEKAIQMTWFYSACARGSKDGYPVDFCYKEDVSLWLSKTNYKNVILLELGSIFDNQELSSSFMVVFERFLKSEYWCLENNRMTFVKVDEFHKSNKTDIWKCQKKDDDYKISGAYHICKREGDNIKSQKSLADMYPEGKSRIYFTLNNEYGYNQNIKPKKKFSDVDTIIAPTAGFNTEGWAKQFKAKKIIFYDDVQEFIDIKRHILMWGPRTIDDLIYLQDNLKPIFPTILFKDVLSSLIGKQIPIEEQLENARWAVENCEIEYIKFDMMKDDKNKLPHGKNILLHLSNIFSFSITHIKWDLHYINNRWDIMVDTDSHIQGTNVWKKTIVK